MSVEWSTQPKPGDLIFDVLGEPMPECIGSVHFYDSEPRTWAVSLPTGVHGWVEWRAEKGWTWIKTEHLG